MIRSRVQFRRGCNTLTRGLLWWCSYAPANTVGHFSWRALPNPASGTLPAAELRQQPTAEGSNRGGTLAAAAAAPSAGASPGWNNGGPWPRSGAAPERPNGLNFGDGGLSPAVSAPNPAGVYGVLLVLRAPVLQVCIMLRDHSVGRACLVWKDSFLVCVVRQTQR